MTRTSNVATRFVQMAARAGCGGLAYATQHVTQGGGGSVGVVLAIGLLLICGTLAGGILEPLRIPHLTAYLAVGVIAGPYVARLIERPMVESLQTVNTLALALIAFAGGAELRIADVKRSMRSLSAAAFTQCILVFVGGAVIFAAVSPFVSFVRGASLAMIAGVSLLWGVLSITRSPAATLAILSQTRAQGPLTTFSLSFVMLSDVLVIVIATTVIALVKPMLDPSATLSLEVFDHLGHEIIGSVSLGTSLGLLMVLYLRLVNKQIPVVLVALGFGFTEVVNYVRLDPLLTFLVAGFLIQNLSKQGDKLLHAIEDMGSVVYVVFFATAGAGLDVPLLRRLWPVALVLFLGRLLLTVVVNRLSCRIANDPPVLRRWGWTGLVSQAGVVLGLAISIARSFPTFGPAFRALAIATVALNQLIGPILFKLALDTTGESSRAAEPSRRSLAPPATA